MDFSLWVVDDLCAALGQENNGLAERNVELFAGTERQLADVISAAQVRPLLQKLDCAKAECTKTHDCFTTSIDPLLLLSSLVGRSRLHYARLYLPFSLGGNSSLGSASEESTRWMEACVSAVSYSNSNIR